MGEAIHERKVSRRRVLQAAGLSGASLFGQASAAAPTSPALSPAAPAPLTPLNRFPRMVHNYIVGLVQRTGDTGRAAKESLRTQAEAEAYVLSVREKIRRCFGPEPERTPLQARVAGVVERDAYRIEKILFQSRPGFLVTANLYIPRGRKFPLPGVVGTCGHSVGGKADPVYQSFSQGLARLGYVVLILDPIGQGERLQYTDAELKPRRGTGTTEHLHAGNQQFLVGEFFGAWRAWDGIRALDYLLTREEVEPRHLGITGNSGGGTLTAWLCGLDRRWTMAAPGCFVTTFRRNLENELPADTEQCPPHALALHLDHEDFLAAMAPKPILILAKERDYFDVRGTLEAYERLKKLYTLLGAPDNIQLHIGPTEHGYSKENREAMYRWFNRCTGISSEQAEPALTLEKEDVLRCTPRGQVAELNSRTVFSFTRDRSRELARARRLLPEGSLRDAILSVLKLPPQPGTAPEFNILRPAGARRYPSPQASTYAVESEPGIHVLVYRLGEQPHYSRPPQSAAPAVLYVSHQSADAELRDNAWVRELVTASPGAVFYACDVRGIGESRPDTCGADQFLRPYGSDYFYAIHSMMLDRPYVGQKCYDVLRVLDWLAACGHREIRLVAQGWGTVPATFAAVLSDRVTQVTLKGAPASYAALAENEDYDWPLSSFVPGILTTLDLPDCYRELEQHKQLRRL